METGKKVSKSISGGLPEEIVEEILPRVSSVKSLLRFKCLSKSLCNVISSKNFAKTQLEKSTAKDLSAVFVTTTYHGDNFLVDRCPVDALFAKQRLDEPDLVHFELEYPKNGYESFRLVGCSNGLCCIYVCKKDFLLFNPYTQKCFKLPSPYDDEQCENEIRGFGYDEANEDYKVLAKSVKHDFFRMYSLKTNTWKTVDDFLGSGDRHIMRDFADYNGRYQFEATGVFVNGKLHWALRSEDSLKIVSFDLRTEAVGVVEPPIFRNDCRANWSMLGVIDGCLCVYRYFIRSGTSVWILKEYGVKESWYVWKTVPYIIRLCEDCTQTPPYPLYVTEEGDVLAVHELQEFIYNINIKFRPKRLVMKNNPCTKYVIGFCVESLISPFPPVSNATEQQAE